MSLSQSYKKFQIEYNEDRDEWIATLGDDVISRSAKLSDLKKTLDRHEKREQSFARVKIIRIKRHADKGWEQGEITSINDEGEAWVIWNNKERQKIWKWDAKTLILATPENLKRADAWNKLQAEILRVQREQETIMKAMETFKSAQAHDPS